MALFYIVANVFNIWMDFYICSWIYLSQFMYSIYLFIIFYPSPSLWELYTHNGKSGKKYAITKSCIIMKIILMSLSHWNGIKIWHVVRIYGFTVEVVNIKKISKIKHICIVLSLLVFTSFSKLSCLWTPFIHRWYTI